MALQKQVIEIRPSGGLRQDVGKWVTYPFGELHNLIYDKFGALEKRPPIREMTTNIYPSTYAVYGTVHAPIVSPTEELLIAAQLAPVSAKAPGEAGTCMWSFSETPQRWVRKTTLPDIVASRHPGIRNQSSISGYPAQVCRVGNYECVLYQTAGGGGYVSITDIVSGSVLLDNANLVSSPGFGNSGKIALFNCGDGYFTFVYTNSTNTQFRRARIDPATLTTSVANIGAAWGTAVDAWDVAPGTSGIFYMVITDAAATEVWRVNSSTPAVTHTHSEASGHLNCSIAFGYTTQSAVAFTWEATLGGSVNVRTLKAVDLTPLTASLAWLAGTFESDVINSLAIGIDDGSRVHLFASGLNATTLYTGLRWKILYTDNTFANGGTAYEIPWQTPCSKPFNLAGQCYILLAHWRDGFPPEGSRYGYALLNLVRNHESISTNIPISLEAAFCPTDGLGVNYTSNAAGIPNIYSSGGVAVLPVHVQGRGSSGLFRDAEWADVIELRCSDYRNEPSLWQPTTASNLLHLPSALPVTYDGQTCCEIGFLEPPQIVYQGGVPRITETPSANGLEPGDYEYYFTWEWVDARGNRHESRPSDPLLVTVVGGPNANLAFYVSTTPMTRRGNANDGEANRPRLVVYRSKKNLASNHYRVPLAPTYNDPQAYDLYVTDTYSDAQLEDEARGQLYTDSGLLEKENPPPAIHMQASAGRVWLTSAEAPEVWPSMQLLRGEPPCFSPFLRITIDDSQTPLVGTASLDNLLVIFSENRIYLLPSSGGPTDTGEGEWGRPEELQSSAGCSSPASILSFALGVFYRDADGFKLLNRGRGIDNIGEPIRDTANAYPTVLNTTLDVQNERIYVLAKNDSEVCMVMVFDYRHNAWSTLSPNLYFDDDGDITTYDWNYTRMSIHRGDLLFSYASKVHRMTSSGVTSPYDAFVDMTPAWITSTFTTPWLMVQAIGGYQRTWRAILEMEKISDHGLQVDFFNDGDESTAVQTETWTSAEIAGLQGLPRERLLIGVAHQKAQSLRISVQDVAPTDAATGSAAGFRYHGLTLEIGSKVHTEKAEKANTR